MAYNICPLRFNNPGDKGCQQKYCSWWHDSEGWCVIWTISARLTAVLKQMPKTVDIGLSHDMLKGIGGAVLKDVMQELNDKQ